MDTMAYYTAHWEDVIKQYESADVPDLHALLRSSFPPKSRLLELGCGSGRDAAFMLSAGFDVTASDGVRQMIDAAAACHPELAGRLRLIRLPEDLAFFSESFDGIYAVAVFMHLTRPVIREVFLKITRLLRPGGWLFFSVPLGRSDVKADEFDDKGRRFTAMTREDWLDTCIYSGFEPISASVSKDGLGRDDITWISILAGCKKMISGK